jgi:integrase
VARKEAPRPKGSVKRRETPIKRSNPSGKTVYLARYTNLEGKRKSAGTHKRKGPCGIEDFGSDPDCCAQHMIDAAYAAQETARAGAGMTLADYAEEWPERHPHPERTAESHKTRLNAALKIPVEGRPLGLWLYRDLKRKHMVDAVDHMLRKEKRAVKGAVGIRNTLSAMTEDAIVDEVAEVNFAKGFKIKANDPRARKPPKKISIWTFDQLREFASAGRAEIRKETEKPKPAANGEPLFYSAVDYEAMLTTIALCNFRIGEVFALRRHQMDLGALLFFPTGTAHKGVITDGDTDEKRHEGEVPIPPSAERVLREMPPRIDTPILFPTPKGTVWHYSTFIRDVWLPAQIASGLPIKPHECRHSYVTHLRAAGVDPADLAEVTRHDIETATRHYTKPLGRSMQQIRDIIG